MVVRPVLRKRGLIEYLQAGLVLAMRKAYAGGGLSLLLTFGMYPESAPFTRESQGASKVD